MSEAENFLHTTHRTVSWFKKADMNGDLQLSPPFQRNKVWTSSQKSYLIDTILSGLPVPELYMQDKGDEEGNEVHVVVDGQQRITAVLGFVHGEYALDGEDVARQWRGRSFDELTPEDKKRVFAYKFVVRILPASLVEEDIRRIFARLNKNVVSLNDQELRNATYWGPFIRTVQRISEENLYWNEAGIFTANDFRRMLDHEYISELAVATLHGPQNKKDKLDDYYQLYESSFEDAETLIASFQKVTTALETILPAIKSTRWRKKSDFYTLFLEVAARVRELPFPPERSEELRGRIIAFGDMVDTALKLEEDQLEQVDERVRRYARNVSRAASDRSSRVARAKALSEFVFEEDSRHVPATTQIAG